MAAQEPPPYLIEANFRSAEVPRPSELFRPGFLEESPHLRDYWRNIRKHGGLVLTIAASIFLLTVVFVFTRTRLYTATSTVLIQPRAPQVLERRASDTNEVEEFDVHDYYKTQYDILKSRSLAAQVIINLDLSDNQVFRPKQKLGLLAGLGQGFFQLVGTLISYLSPPQENNPIRRSPSEPFGTDPGLIDHYLAGLKISPQFGTRLVIVGFTSPDPVLAANIVNEHVKTYIRRGMELHSEESRTAEDFLTKKLAALKDRVE